MLNIFVRTDASTEIGTGHVMRCLTLSDMLRSKGANIKFICQILSGNMIDYIKKRGYKVEKLPANMKTDDEFKYLIEYSECSFSVNWLIVDHYKINFSRKYDLSPFTKRIMVIDDLKTRPLFCHLLLNQNLQLSENPYAALLPSDCKVLMGPQYALIRPDFISYRKKMKRQFGNPQNILVLMGGVDPNNQTLKALKALSLLGNLNISVKAIVGTQYPFYRKLVNEKYPFELTVFQDVSNVAEMMVWADLSIGAGGATSWERCCLGLPGLIIILAENQRDIANALDKNGCCINLGWYEDVEVEGIKNCVKYLLDDPEVLKEMSIKSMNLVDGYGAKRISEILLNT